MKNIECQVEIGPVLDKLKTEIQTSFAKRIEGIDCENCRATVIINPDMSKYPNAKSLRDDINRYLIDDNEVVDSVTLVRLAGFMPQQTDLSLLYIFEKYTSPNAEIQGHIESSDFAKASILDGSVYIPEYLLKEADSIVRFIYTYRGQRDCDYHVYCISGDCGMGKTFFVNLVSSKLNEKVCSLSYGDIDAENTGLIDKKIKNFFSDVSEFGIVLIEDADSFLVGQNANRFVKNLLLANVRKRKDIVFFIETVNPSAFDPDLRSLIFHYTFIKPISTEQRIAYLSSMLGKAEIVVPSSVLHEFPTVGFSVRDLAHVSFVTKSLITKGQDSYIALKNAIEQVAQSKLNASICSDEPFRAIKPKYQLNDMVLPQEKMKTIRFAVSMLSNISLVYDKWGFSRIDPHPRAILNFYGKPGTGKTMCAHAVAHYLNKDLLALNYAEIESKYIGDAPKKLESAFSYARQHNTVMFFDEADSFLGKRIEDVSHSADQALNSLRSTMLIQLEMFEGVVIFASNLRENYDKAFKSRFLYEIEFELPDAICRESLIRSYIGKLIPLQNANFLDEQIQLLAEHSEGLSGRELKSAVLEALNELAFEVKKNGDEKADVVMDFTVIDSCLVKRVKDLSPQVSIATGENLESDKKLIGDQLMGRYATKDNNTSKYSALIVMAYYAAWADGSVHEKELALLEEAKRDLDVDLPDYKNKSDLPSLYQVISEIKVKSLEKKAIELCIRIVAADGVYLELEKDFIHMICSDLGYSEEKISVVDSIVQQIMDEGKMLSLL